MRQTAPAPLRRWSCQPDEDRAGGETTLPVGRLPEEAVFYNKQIVVLNTGYYTEERQKRQEISIVDPASGGRSERCSRAPCFPAPRPVWTETSISVAGSTRWSTRYYHKFKLVQQYPVQGYAGGLAPIDADHLAVVYLVVRVNSKSEKVSNMARENWQFSIPDRENRT